MAKRERGLDAEAAVYKDSILVSKRALSRAETLARMQAMNASDSDSSSDSDPEALLRSISKASEATSTKKGKRARLEVFKSEQLSSKMDKSNRGKGSKGDSQVEILDLLSDSDEEHGAPSSDEDDIDAILNPEKDRGSLSLSSSASTFASEAVAEENKVRRNRSDMALHKVNLRERQRAVLEELQPEATAIEIIVRRSNGTQNKIKIGVKTKWSVTAANLCNYLKVPRESVEFYFDLLLLNPNKTAEECFIGEGDEIEMRDVVASDAEQEDGIEKRIEAELDEELGGEGIAVFTLKLKDASGNVLAPMVTSSFTVRELMDKWEAAFPDQKGTVVLNFDGENLNELTVLETLDCEEDDLFDVMKKY